MNAAREVIFSAPVWLAVCIVYPAGCLTLCSVSGCRCPVSESYYASPPSGARDLQRLAEEGGLCPSIEISCDSTTLRNDDLRWVPRLRGLHCLYFNDADWPGGFRLNREGLGFILQARELTDLVIPVGPDIDGIPEELAGLDQLRFLRIVGPIGGSGMHAIARLPKLEALFLDGCALSPDVAVLFQRGFPSLYTLGIRNATVPTEIWEALAEAGSLDTLIIASVDGQSLPLEQVGRIASLGRLSISGTDLSGKDISALSELKDLRHLDVVSAGVDTRQASAVTWPPALRRLDLSGNPIGAEFLRQACLPPLLGALHVEHTGISGDDVVAASRVNPRIGRICIYTGEAFRDSMPEDVKTPVEEPSKTQ